MALGEDEGLGIAVGQLGVQPPDLQVGGGRASASATLPTTARHEGACSTESGMWVCEDTPANHALVPGSWAGFLERAGP